MEKLRTDDSSVELISRGVRSVDLGHMIMPRYLIWILSAVGSSSQCRSVLAPSITKKLAKIICISIFDESYLSLTDTISSRHQDCMRRHVILLSNGRAKGDLHRDCAWALNNQVCAPILDVVERFRQNAKQSQNGYAAHQLQCSVNDPPIIQTRPNKISRTSSPSRQINTFRSQSRILVCATLNIAVRTIHWRSLYRCRGMKSLSCFRNRAQATWANLTRLIICWDSVKSGLMNGSRRASNISPRTESARMSPLFRWVELWIIEVANIDRKFEKFNGPWDIQRILWTEQRLNRLRCCGRGVKEGEYRVIGPIDLREALEPEGEKASVVNNIIDKGAFKQPCKHSISVVQCIK